MEKATLALRIILGLIYFVFGLNGFLNFIAPPELPDAAVAFMGGLMSAGYLLPMVKLLEVICGAMLLSGKFVPLALVILAPITVNIFMMHAMLAPDGLVMAVPMLIFHLFLGYRNLPAYSGMLKA